MKTRWINKMVMLFFLMWGGTTVFGQGNQSELPGDNFSLEGALELFKKSSSPQEFERLLNSSDSRVNNLDLNGDNDIDYIKVIDRNEGNVHAFILQAIISATESQDVAVIELEKLANGKAVLQITGDADIYGIETIIEPTEEVRVNAGTSTARNVVNVWAWPSVQYVYTPYYSVWVSPWEWGMRPVWWTAWRPVSYYMYDPWWDAYRPYYSACYTHRVIYAHHLYMPMRTTSVVVYDRHHSQITDYRSSHNESNYDARSRYDNDGTRGRHSSTNYQHNEDVGGRRSSPDRNTPSLTNRWNDRQDGQQSNHRSSVVQRDRLSYGNNDIGRNDIDNGRRSSFNSPRIQQDGNQRTPSVPQRQHTGNMRTTLPQVSQHEPSMQLYNGGGRQRNSDNQNNGQGNRISAPLANPEGTIRLGEQKRGRH